MQFRVKPTWELAAPAATLRAWLRWKGALIRASNPGATVGLMREILN